MLQRVLRRIKNRVLTEPNVPYYTWRYVANARPTLLAFLNRPTTPGIEHAVATLRRDGIITAPSAEFLGAMGADALPEVQNEMLRMDAATETPTAALGEFKDYMLRVIQENQPISADHPLVRLALDQKLLEIIAGYMGLWPRLSSVAAWINFHTDGPARDAQLWHRDPDDIHLIKAFIYLSDVDETRGPFTYIPGTQAFGRNTSIAKQFESRQRTTDEDIAAAFPPETWLECKGPAGTMIIADTKGYHRGGRVDRDRRLLVTFTYVSAHPYRKIKHRIEGQPSWNPSRLQQHVLSG